MFEEEREERVKRVKKTKVTKQVWTETEVQTWLSVCFGIKDVLLE